MDSIFQTWSEFRTRTLPMQSQNFKITFLTFPIAKYKAIFCLGFQAVLHSITTMKWRVIYQNKTSHENNGLAHIISVIVWGVLVWRRQYRSQLSTENPTHSLARFERIKKYKRSDFSSGINPAKNTQSLRLLGEGNEKSFSNIFTNKQN